MSGVELAAALAVAGCAAAVVVRLARGRARAGILALLFLVTGGAATRGDRRAAAAPTGAPGASVLAGFAGSGACLGCHPSEHASFSRTYHRTMTQLATPATVLAPLERRGDEVWATLPDPDAEGDAAPATVTRRVVLTTGSHREQAYWVAGKRAGDLRLVPSVWLVRDRALVPRAAAFITPPGAPLPRVRWASSCIACHAVAGEPRHDPVHDAFDTRVAELGIACEACHGPGAAHADKHRDPVARYIQHSSKAADPSIVNPRRLAPERSAAVCGQCHAYAFPRDEAGWWTDGYARSFRAGDLLEPSRALISPATIDDPHAPKIDVPIDAIFWPDGAVRVGGREYNGLVESPCFVRGAGARKMTCVSCHAMHAGDPAGQIAPDRAGDRGCTGCHPGTPRHGHHREGSPGDACVACHMPKTSYALLEGVRSHRIDSPRAEAGKPSACELCHLDRSRAWTAGWLRTWYGGQAQAIEEGPPAGLVHGIAGDAGTRAIVAAALGAAEGAAPPAFRAALLDQIAEEDPYDAVRWIAARARRPLPPAPAPLDRDAVRMLLAGRDRRAITIAE